MKLRSSVPISRSTWVLRCVPLEGIGLMSGLEIVAEEIQSATLQFSGYIPSRKELAEAIGTDLEQFDRALESLAKFDLVQIEPNGAITIVPLIGSFERRLINRANGQHGGRPPKQGARAKRETGGG